MPKPRKCSSKDSVIFKHIIQNDDLTSRKVETALSYQPSIKTESEIVPVIEEFQIIVTEVLAQN